MPAIGPERAAQVAQLLAQLTLATVDAFAATSHCDICVAYAEGPAAEAEQYFGKGRNYILQRGSDLGQRLSHVLKECFQAGYRRVLVIGTDCPELSSADLRDAFSRLDTTDVVIGPASDGGYYLIGMTRARLELFESISWGTAQVFEQTRQRAKASGLKLATIQTRSDLDNPEDLLLLRGLPANNHQELFPTVSGKLTIIIPTLNEAENLTATLSAIATDHPIEVIVVDAGSIDRTPAIAQEYGCQVLTIDRGRGRQQNAGAAIASGQYLLFLHADTQLPRGYFDEIVTMLANPGVIAGAFKLRVNSRQQSLRLIEAAANLRSRYLHLPYGDQAIFLRSSDFYRLGGFKSLPIMEDFELVDRLRRLGKVSLSQHSVTTSDRRWKAKGVWRTTWINQCCVLLYRLGISTERIARIYRGPKRAAPDQNS
jgi:uncharacterized protein